MHDEMLQASSMAQAWYAEGFEKGRLEAARKLAQIVLERRFGELDQDMLEALNQARRDTLEELVLMLVSLAGIQFRKEALLSALRRNSMIDDLWKESSAARMLLEEGEAKGRAVGMRKSVQLLLEARFGAEMQSLLQALQTADEPTLRAILAHPADSLEQVRVRLGLE